MKAFGGVHGSGKMFDFVSKLSSGILVEPFQSCRQDIVCALNAIEWFALLCFRER